MRDERTAIFLINLVQDINVLRPLIFMAARDFNFRVVILVSAKFEARDLFGIWKGELETLRAQTGAEVQVFESDWHAFQHLKGAGIIFAGSESSLPGHSTTHTVFRYAPSTFLKVTLQHGFECVGFRHSSAHDSAHGKSISFAADVLCAWQPPELQTSMPLSQRAKAHLTGPTAALQQFTGEFERAADAPGIVCENLHSVRLNTHENLKGEFVHVFGEFCRHMSRERRNVVLRPHPGGQYALKNKVSLPINARVNNAPMYRLDLRRFAYGISAPSSVLVDMLLAQIPTAVWRDQQGSMNTDNYVGLTGVSTAKEWLEFAREAVARPEPFVEQQRGFLERERIPIEPRDVFTRYAEIFQAASRLEVRTAPIPVERQRILFVANAHLPTLQACFERPLSPLIRSGELVVDLLTEKDLANQEAALGSFDAVVEWIGRTLGRFAPDAVIFSRYSGPHSADIVSWARSRDVPVIYHIDDDLLAIPPALGRRKYAYHNSPQRLATVRSLLTSSSLVYSSTDLLRERLLSYYPDIRVIAGQINCSGRVLRPPKPGAARTIGYTGYSDHLPNLMMVLPALITILDRHPQISFELFGPIPVPEELARFGDRVRKIESVPKYEAFLMELSERCWDIGICPLVPNKFNLTKSNNKWIEYTSAGIAVVASGNMVYDECCAEGSGILVESEAEWTAALELLVTDDSERIAMVERAQQRLESDFGIPQHRQQILDVLELARAQLHEGCNRIGAPVGETV
jgi:glycosyltransferase involved in cell wall biosynthesis